MVHARRRNVPRGIGSATTTGGEPGPGGTRRAHRTSRHGRALAAERRSAAQPAVDATTGDVAAASSSRIEPVTTDHWGIQYEPG
jgi:hypothetical protein